MKNVLCFGDSNTFGYNPQTGERYKENSRWSGILKNNLKDKFNIIEAGCCNRTAFCNNPAGTEYTGYKIINQYLKKDIDILIFALGINDLQRIYNSQMNEMKQGLENIIDLARRINPNIQICIVGPSQIKEEIANSYFGILFGKSSIEKSIELNKLYEGIAKEKNCIFINFNEITEASNIDGLHYTEEQHKLIAKIIENNYFKKIF